MYFKGVMLLLWLFENYYATLKTVTATFLSVNVTKAKKSS